MVNRPPAAFSRGLQKSSSKDRLDVSAFRKNSSADNLLNFSYNGGNEATFVLQQPIDSCLMNGDTGKDEEEYLEKVQEVSCPVSLTDEKHRDLLLNRLATLRKHKEFCDVALYAEEKEIFCHKVVLSALSPSFYELFSAANDGLSFAGNDSAGVVVDNAISCNGSHQASGGTHKFSWRNNQKFCAVSLPGRKLPQAYSSDRLVDHPSKDGVLSSANEACQTVTSSLPGDRMCYYEFCNIDYCSLSAIVNFAYSGTLEIKSDQVAQLYKAAVALRVQTCVKACAAYLMKTLSVKNCIALRRCANRTSDMLLGNQIDLFIQKNFHEIVCNSNEFTSLPCIQPYMLYMDPEGNLQDCNDLDDNSSVASCDLVQDYKKQTRMYPKKSKSGSINALTLINSSQQTGQSSQTSNFHTPTLNSTANGNSSRLFRVLSNESVNSFASEAEELDWKTIAVLKNSENYYVMLAIVKGKLTAISLRVNEAPFCKPGLTDRLSLMLKHGDQQADGDSLATMTDQRCNIGAVYLDGCLIVCGGNNRGECLKSVESFNPCTNKWTSLPPMLKERGRFGACVCEGKIYAVGGSNGSYDLNTCESFDPSLNAWARMAPFESGPRSNNSTVSVGGKVYCVGGWDGQAAVRHVDCYDPATNSWHPVAPLAVGRYQAGCCAWGNYIIVVGGCDTWSCLSSAELYDPSTNSWCNLPPMIAPRRGCGAAVLNNQLYVAGGSDGSQTLCSVELLNLNDLPSGAPSWRPGPALNMPRGNVRLVATDCCVYAVGGFSGKLFTNSIEYLDKGANEWRTTIVVPAPKVAAEKSSPVHSLAIVEDSVGEAIESSSSGAAIAKG